MVAGFAGQLASRPPLLRTAIPAAFKYRLAVSRRTPVDSSIRRSDQPSRPSARTDCLLSSFETLLIPSVDHVPTASSTSRRLLVVAGSQVSLSGRFWVSPEATPSFLVNNPG